MDSSYNPPDAGGQYNLPSIVSVTAQLNNCTCLLQPLKYTIGIRMDEVEEALGSDYVEHGIPQDSRQSDLSNFFMDQHNGEKGSTQIAAPTMVSQRTFFGGKRDVPSLRLRQASAKKVISEDRTINCTTISNIETDIDAPNSNDVGNLNV